MNEINTVIEEKFTRCPQCRSYSVKVTEDLTPKERMKSKFVSVNAFLCHNCSYRFVEYGDFSTTVKRVISDFYNGVERKWLFAVVPLVLVVLLIGWIWLLPMFTGSGPIDSDNHHTAQLQEQPPPPEENVTNPNQDNQEQVETGENNTSTPANTESQQESTPDQTEQTTPPADSKGEQTENQTQETETPAPQTQSQESAPQIDGYIVLENSNRFGVNWNTVADGVQIIRLSNGPLKSAGIRLQDIIAEVEKKPVGNGNQLLRIRNEVFGGRRKDALIKVLRNGDILHFKLVKTKPIKDEVQQKEKPEKKENTAGNSEDQPGEKPQTQVLKVFSRNNLKVRSSAPDVESPVNRWGFLRKVVSIKRNSQQKVLVSGNATGTGKWAVDDRLIINDRTFKGLSASYPDTHRGELPQSVRQSPLDITDIVPADKEFRLRMVLADHGILWGNTDIYIVVK